MPEQTDTSSFILSNATIYTGDGPLIPHGYVAIANGRIVDVGPQTNQPTSSPTMPIIDLQGAFVMPGIVESHGHLLSYGEIRRQVDVTMCADLAATKHAIVEHNRRLAESAWLLGWGWDEHRWRSGKLDARLLDTWVGNRPAAISRIDGHALWVNSHALAAAGITAITRDPVGGRIERGADGQPTGILVDKAMDLVQQKVPPDNAEDREAVFLEAAHECLRLGITSFHDAWTSRDDVLLYERLQRQGRLPLRMYLMLDGRDDALLDDYFARGTRPGSIDDYLAIRSIKLFADGALGSRGAALLEPYTDDVGNSGLVLTTTEQIRDLTVRALTAKFQVCTHAIGDRANKMVLDAYEQASQKYPGAKSSRLRVEHAQLLQPEDIGRFGALGAIAAVQPTHCTSDWEWALKRLGTERCRRTGYRWRSLWESGALVALGSDVPIESPNPLLGLYAAVTRTSPKTQQLLASMTRDECLSREQALQAMTCNGAYAAHQESWLGKLAPSYGADIAVWSHNLLSCTDSDILRAHTVMTIIGGQVVFRAI